jgi:hypothetical protein
LCDAFLYQRFVDHVVAIHRPSRYVLHPPGRQLPESMSL